MGGVAVVRQVLCDAAVLGVGTASSGLTAHSGPFLRGKQRFENLSCASLLIRFTLALGLRFLM